MKTRTYLIQGATLVAAAIVLALVSNAFASRDRQMKLVGFYPNAQKVPAREEPVAAPAAVAPVATTASQPPVTGSQLPVATTTQAPPTTPAPSTQHPAPAPPAEDPLKKFTPHDKQPYIEIAYNDVKLLHDRGAL